MTAPLPNPNRIITDTDASGKAVVSTALPESLPLTKGPEGAYFRLAYNTTRPPTDPNSGDIAAYAEALENPPPLFFPGGGTSVWYVDTPPEGESPLHRTTSLDFIVVLKGEVELQLDGGETRIVKEGDMVVQRATMHKWRNTSKTEWARILSVMSESEAVEVGGKKLEQVFL